MADALPIETAPDLPTGAESFAVANVFTVNPAALFDVSPVAGSVEGSAFAPERSTGVGVYVPRKGAATTNRGGRPFARTARTGSATDSAFRF